MDKIFGQIDAVEGGEQQEAKEIAVEESAAVGKTIDANPEVEKGTDVRHVEAAKDS
jgi:hypothetical protein